MLKARILLPIIIITAIIALFAFSFIFFKNSISVSLEKAEYRISEEGKVVISNNSGKKICFSSCYPFYFEKNGVATNYADCGKEDLAEKCFSNGKKAFKFNFPSLEAGDYRMAIPVCDSCAEGDKFIKSKWIYSNNFKVIL